MLCISGQRVNVEEINWIVYFKQSVSTAVTSSKIEKAKIHKAQKTARDISTEY